MSNKFEEYEKYKTVNNITGTVEIANAFYVAYAMGYASSSEDAYSESQRAQDNVRLQAENESLKEQLKGECEVIDHIIEQDRVRGYPVASEWFYLARRAVEAVKARAE